MPVASRLRHLKWAVTDCQGGLSQRSWACSVRTPSVACCGSSGSMRGSLREPFGCRNCMNSVVAQMHAAIPIAKMHVEFRFRSRARSYMYGGMAIASGPKISRSSLYMSAIMWSAKARVCRAATASHLRHSKSGRHATARNPDQSAGLVHRSRPVRVAREERTRAAGNGGEAQVATMVITCASMVKFCKVQKLSSQNYSVEELRSRMCATLRPCR